MHGSNSCCYKEFQSTLECNIRTQCSGGMFGYTAHKTGSKTVSTFLNRLLAMRMADQARLVWLPTRIRSRFKMVSTFLNCLLAMRMARLWLPPRLLCVSLRRCDIHFLLGTRGGWLSLQAVQRLSNAC